MNKILYYECRRLMGNKIFIGLSLVTILCSWQLLTSSVILGIANTAPFSPWSFGYYLSSVVPFLCAIELFFIRFFTSKSEEKVSAITSATSVNKNKYTLIRCTSIAIGMVIIVIIVVALCIVFYKTIFDTVPLQPLFLPAILSVIPSLIFTMGAGWLVGRHSQIGIYVLLAIQLLVSYIPSSQKLYITGIRFFSEYPLSLGVLDPAFKLEISYLISRLILLIIGAVLMVTIVNSRKINR